MGSGSTMVKQDPPPILQVLTMVGKDHPDNANNSGLQQQHRLGGVLWILRGVSAWVCLSTQAYYFSYAWLWLKGGYPPTTPCPSTYYHNLRTLHKRDVDIGFSE